MRTYRLEPAIGQRYVHRQLGAQDTLWVITAISPPSFITESIKIKFSEELTQRVFYLSVPQFAHQILDGNLRSQQMPDPSLDDAPIALTDLLMRMSSGQLERFKMRVDYVQTIERANVGISFKSPAFVQLIKSHHMDRMHAWHLRKVGMTEQVSLTVEAKAPSATSVYRWCLRYRNSCGDLRVLAQEALATRTRSKRKPQEWEVLNAFLINQKSAIGTQSVSRLTDDFNRLMRRTDPLHTGDLIDDLLLKAKEKVQQNKSARSGKSSMRKKSKRSAESIPSRL